MKNKLSQMALKAGQAVSAAASKTADYVQTHKPTEQDMAQAKAMALKAGKSIANETMSLSKEVARRHLGWRRGLHGHREASAPAVDRVAAVNSRNAAAARCNRRSGCSAQGPVCGGAQA